MLFGMGMWLLAAFKGVLDVVDWDVEHAMWLKTDSKP